MGATLSDQLTRFFNIEKEERKILLVAGAGAGFGAAIGAPWAGVIFGMEVICVGRLRLFAWVECLIASFVAYYTSILLHAPHSHYPLVEIPAFSFLTIINVILAGILFGLTANVFSRFTHFIERLQKKWVHYPPLKPFLGGLLLILLYRVIGTYKFAGLGIDVIQKSLQSTSSFSDPLLKGFFTALTVGTGFKGGEFIPLVFIGTTLGSALSTILPLSFGFLGALGFASVFGGAANTPLACSIMAAEIFGWHIFPFAFVSCYASFYFSGHHGVYPAQKYHAKKHDRLSRILNRSK